MMISTSMTPIIAYRLGGGDVAGISEQMIIDIKVLGARQAALEARMVKDEVGGVGTATTKAGKQAEKSKAGFSSLGSSMKGMIGMAGAAGLAYGLVGVVKAGMSWQQQQVQLQGALQKTGNYSKATMDKITGAATALSQKGGYSATENLHAVQVFTQETGNSTLALKALSSATDLARG